MSFINRNGKRDTLGLEASYFYDYLILVSDFTNRNYGLLDFIMIKATIVSNLNWFDNHYSYILLMMASEIRFQITINPYFNSQLDKFNDYLLFAYSFGDSIAA